MNMTDQAKDYIKKAMEAKNVSTIRFYGIAGCCGMNLGVALQDAEENDILEEINGLTVAIQPNMKDQLNVVTVDVEENNGEMGIVLNGYDNTSCC
jgi:iron-sulfur cluster assembly protein